MKQPLMPLMNKCVLIVEDDAIFRSILVSYLRSLGATTIEAFNGHRALELLKDQCPDLIVCDLVMPEMGGIAFIKHLTKQGRRVPILIISATDTMADIDQVLHLGVKDILLKPIVDLNRLREAALACLYPNMFISPAVERSELIQNWDALRNNPQEATRLLNQPRPPLQQVVARCKVNYHQITLAENPLLVINIESLSEKELAFYCLDVTQSGDHGVLAALLLKMLFNSLLQDHLAQRRQRLPQMSSLLKQINQLICQTQLNGLFPLLIGYYHAEYKNLVIASAGLHANITAGEKKIQLANSMPLGSLNILYAKQISQHCEAWQCQVSGKGSRLKLTLSPLSPE